MPGHASVSTVSDTSAPVCSDSVSDGPSHASSTIGLSL